jgi:hypothetical protein
MPSLMIAKNSAVVMPNPVGTSSGQMVRIWTCAESSGFASRSFVANVRAGSSMPTQTTAD